jgi:hypothetical protein
MDKKKWPESGLRNRHTATLGITSVDRYLRRSETSFVAVAGKFLQRRAKPFFSGPQPVFLYPFSISVNMVERNPYQIWQTRSCTRCGACFMSFDNVEDNVSSGVESSVRLATVLPRLMPLDKALLRFKYAPVKSKQTSVQCLGHSNNMAEHGRALIVTDLMVIAIASQYLYCPALDCCMSATRNDCSAVSRP